MGSRGRLTWSLAAVAFATGAQAQTSNAAVDPGPVLDDRVRAVIEASRTANTGVGEVGQRQSVYDGPENYNPLLRLNSRVNNRVRNRISNRIDRSFRPIEDQIDPRLYAPSGSSGARNDYVEPSLGLPESRSRTWAPVLTIPGDAPTAEVAPQ